MVLHLHEGAMDSAATGHIHSGVMGPGLGLVTVTYGHL